MSYTTPFLMLAAVLPAAVLASCQRAPAGDAAAEILAQAKASMTRWGEGDVDAVLQHYAQDFTYFDPGLERRMDGYAAIEAYYRPMAGKMKIARFEMLNPRVQVAGETAVLTYNLFDEVSLLPTGPTRQRVTWNVTSVYVRQAGQWKVIHEHFSYVKNQPPVEVKEGER